MFLSPSGESQVSEEEGGCEVWIGSCEGHRAVLSVVGYSGQFVSLEVNTKFFDCTVSTQRAQAFHCSVYHVLLRVS